MGLVEEKEIVMRGMFDFAVRLRLMALFLTGCVLPAQEPVKAMRVESVRIDVQTCKLTWTITEGKKDESGKFIATDYREFSIDLEKATMEELTLARPDGLLSGKDRKTTEVREFEQQEADAVHRVTDILAQYTGESTAWWDAGKGRKKPEGQIASTRRKP